MIRARNFPMACNSLRSDLRKKNDMPEHIKQNAVTGFDIWLPGKRFFNPSILNSHIMIMRKLNDRIKDDLICAVVLRVLMSFCIEESDYIYSAIFVSR
jgi:hypothetical protein